MGDNTHIEKSEFSNRDAKAVGVLHTFQYSENQLQRLTEEETMCEWRRICLTLGDSLTNVERNALHRVLCNLVTYVSGRMTLFDRTMYTVVGGVNWALQQIGINVFDNINILLLVYVGESERYVRVNCYRQKS